jgi:hypothetical protein
MKKFGDLGKIGIKKIKIFKDEQHTASGEDANDQIDLLSSPLRFLDENSRSVIDGDGQSQNEDVNRDESHIEDTTCRQQKKPAIPMGNDKIESRHGGEKN